jgi:tellurite methyltransferase
VTDRLGWEPIWQLPEVPKRFSSFAAPNNTVKEWAGALPPGATILDVGCGVGRHCIFLGAQGFRMAGIDISPTGVARASAACSARGIRFEGRVGDMVGLPWSDSSFDAALSIATIHHHLRADVQKALDEVWRVLKPGGMFLVDFPNTNTLDYERMRAETTSGHQTEPECNTFVDVRPEPEDIDGYLPHHFCDEADLQDLLRRFAIERLWEDVRPARPQRGPGMVGKWVAWARKPSTVKAEQGTDASQDSGELI